MYYSQWRKIGDKKLTFQYNIEMFLFANYDWTNNACMWSTVRSPLVSIKVTKWHCNALWCCRKIYGPDLWNYWLWSPVGRTSSCWITPHDTLMEGLVFLITVWTLSDVHKWFHAILPTLRPPIHLIYSCSHYPLYSGLVTFLFLGSYSSPQYYRTFK